MFLEREERGVSFLSGMLYIGGTEGTGGGLGGSGVGEREDDDESCGVLPDVRKRMEVRALFVTGVDDIEIRDNRERARLSCSESST